MKLRSHPFAVLGTIALSSMLTACGGGANATPTSTASANAVASDVAPQTEAATQTEAAAPAPTDTSSNVADAAVSSDASTAAAAPAPVVATTVATPVTAQTAPVVAAPVTTTELAAAAPATTAATPAVSATPETTSSPAKSTPDTTAATDAAGSSGTSSSSTTQVIRTLPVTYSTSVAPNFPAGVTNSTVASTSTAFVERFEQVATNGLGSTSTGIYNQWGGHQPRVTHHLDGTVRMIYLTPYSSSAYKWIVVRRSASSSTWTQEASGLSTDDVSLVRDPVTDQAYVVAYNNSVPTVYASPSYAPVVVPGTWQKMSTSSRHYGNVGIGPDGTLCVKASVEMSTSVPTSNTNTVYTCGHHTSATGGWAWNPQITQYIGLRHAYDYMFPGGFGDPSQLVASAQWDLYKTAAGVPNASFGYVFNGVRFYTTGTGSASTWHQTDPVTPIPTSVTETVAPTERPVDTFIDSVDRLWTIYTVSDPQNSMPAGLYLAVYNSNGSVLYKHKLSLPTYGFSRVFEDVNGRYWILWTNQGSQYTQMQLYRLNISTASPMNVTLGTMTDLSAKLKPYSIQGSVLLSVPRGGQTVGNEVDAEMIACSGTYVSGKSLQCYPSGNQNTQRIFHLRIHLPS